MKAAPRGGAIAAVASALGKRGRGEASALTAAPALTSSVVSAAATTATADSAAGSIASGAASAASSAAASASAGVAASLPSPTLGVAVGADATTALAAAGFAGVHPSWAPALLAEARKPYFAQLRAFVAAARARGPVFPAEADVFRALAYDAAAVKVVILGQDPYHGAGQAHGLAFSVRRGVPLPPSLVNILKEVEADVGGGGGVRPAHGCLEAWAAQGVLLLNAVLTVDSGRANSHAGRGWEELTDAVLRVCCGAQRGRTVFMLWGLPAQRRGQAAGVVDGARHLVLTAPHPSPLSAYRGFLGCRHFSAANAFLDREGRGAVDWRLPA